MSEQTSHKACGKNHDQQKTVDVLLPIPVNRCYSYMVPKHFNVSLGMLVKVPFGPRDITGVVWYPANISEKNKPKKLKPILLQHDCQPLKKDLIDFIIWMANYTVSPLGMVLRMALRIPSAFEPEKPIKGYRLEPQYPEILTPARKRVLSLLENGSSWPKAEIAKTAGVSTSVINGLIKQKVLKEIWLPPSDDFFPPKPNHKIPKFNSSQKVAIKQLIKHLNQNQFKTILLEGVTGSGKTEVYFEAIAKTLERKQQILVLLPEIALTTSFLKRFTDRFGATPASWHSSISTKHRTMIWRGVASGKIRIVIGARSALFLPFKELGLIVVDEEHDTAYKQEEGIIYNARDMAIVRANITKFPVILSSATPSIETYYNAKRGRYAHVKLNKRYSKANLPELHIIDMRLENLQSDHWLAPSLIELIDETLKQKQQSLLFLNRRGYAPLTICRKCGYRFQCTSCSTWLVEHRFKNSLSCHQCGYTQIKPKLCPQCKSEDTFAACGPGVERIAEEIENIFPKAKTLILSSDLSSNIKHLRHQLDIIAKGEIDIVIGTQLVAKGHHFPYMRLVGVVDADIALEQNDLRAAERCFQILTQVTGRAGREGGKSFGYIQTYQPHHPVIRTLIQNTKDTFYENELSERQGSALPPFGRLAALIISGRDKIKTAQYANTIVQFAPISNQEHIRIFGPSEAPLKMIRGRYRFRILAHAHKKLDVSGFIRHWLKIVPKASGSIRTQVDIDPISFF